jgi:hypothetical protein
VNTIKLSKNRSASGVAIPLHEEGV